jgi:hypothetical protein
MISDLLNAPIKVKLADKELQISRLSIGEIFGLAEIKVRESYLKDIQSVSAFLIGKEKIEFLGDAMKSIPKGEELYSKSMEYLQSSKGVSEILMIALNKHQKMSEDEITQLIVNSDNNDVSFVINYIIGIDNNEVKEVKKEEETQDQSKKK